MIRGVLFVCIGNLCRSPMAEALLRRAMPLLKVASAGLCAQPGMPADPNAVAVMRRHGIDISEHRARLLNTSMCTTHDVVLVMDKALKHDVLSRYPQLRGRVHTLADESIADPYRLPYDAFVECYASIAEAVGAWQPRLHALARASVREES
jgi:protein-tyrosine phosphatase